MRFKWPGRIVTRSRITTLARPDDGQRRICALLLLLKIKGETPPCRRLHRAHGMKYFIQHQKSILGASFPRGRRASDLILEMCFVSCCNGVCGNNIILPEWTDPA